MSRRPLTELLLFWFPLSANWILMGLEGPVIASFIARFPDQKINLAAHGVAFTLGLLVESPIMMMLSASNALVRGQGNYRRLRNFNLALCVALTVVMLAFQIPWAWEQVSALFGLAPDLSHRTRMAALFLLPWPAAIGIRRFYHGLLIASGSTAAVAWGTLVRLVSMVGVCVLLSASGALPPYCLGTTAVATGVVVEMIYAWVLARRQVKSLLTTPDPDRILSLGELARYYVPLALTSVIALAITPTVTLFMGRFPLPLESMAVHPLVTNFVFLCSCPGIALQEVLITWFSTRQEHHELLRKVTAWTALAGLLVVLAVALTPLRSFWFGNLTGLQEPLLALVTVPLLVLSLQAATNTALSWMRARLMLSRDTSPITWAASLEIAGITIALAALLLHRSLPGASAAAVALIVGRLLAITYLNKKISAIKPHL